MKPTLAIYGIQDRIDGMPFHVHDHNLCLMHEAKLTTYMQLERYTRRKYDNTMHQFIEEIIDNKTIELPPDFDLVMVNSFVGSSFISQNGRLRFDSCVPEHMATDLIKAKAYFQKDKYIGNEIDAYLLNHELAHVASCLPFYGVFRENSLLVHFDGGASLGNFSAFVFRNGLIQLLENHWEMAEYSKFFNDNALAFMMLNAQASEHTSVPGKLMGFAALGNYRPEIANWLCQNNYFKTIWNHPETFIQAVYNEFGLQLDAITQQNTFIQDCAVVFQYEFERAVLQKLERLKQQTGAEYLYYTGGCALNIRTNTKIVESGLFTDVFIPPCCNDSGLSIGAAAFMEWKKYRHIRLHLAYLNNFGLADLTEEFDANLIAKTAKLLSEGKIVGIANGFAECGPRALGNRSLLCLANNKLLSQKISMQVKKREWYRPVAPIMLEKNARYFTGKQHIHHLSKFMLLDFDIPLHRQAELQGAVHVNGTSRIQTIFARADNPFIFELLQYLDTHYNIKALINTSFNAAGEPIVHTAEQALASALKMDIDALVSNFSLKILK